MLQHTKQYSCLEDCEYGKKRKVCAMRHHNNSLYTQEQPGVSGIYNQSLKWLRTELQAAYVN